MARIRPFLPGDEPALAEICTRTGDAGGDATGLYSSDDLLGAIFVLPYVARHPDYAWVVESDDGSVIGYVVGAPDTRAFDAWFRDEWWPRYREQFPPPAGLESDEDRILDGAYRRGHDEDHATDHPAHLHIDLLPEAQGQGFGRALIETLMGRFRDAGLPGVHLVASARNAGAAAFYPRVGFTLVPSEPGILVYVRAL